MNIIYIKRCFLFAGLIILLGTVNSASSQSTEKKYTKESRYLFYLPENYGKDTTEKWPVILFLHGGGERGDDLEKVKAHGPPRYIAKGNKLPFIVVSPQISAEELWNPDLVVRILKDIIKDYRVDENRIYLTGLSIGGHGVWEVAEKYPEIFAAIAPVSGWGDPMLAWKMRHTPVWIFHGAKDRVVPVIASTVMADTLKKYDNVKLTVYPKAGHDCWTEVYINDKIYNWFLQHKRFTFEQVKLNKAPEKFTGLFISDIDTATIFRVDNNLWIRYGLKGSRELQMKPSSDSTFFIRNSDLAEIQCFTENGGAVSSFLFYDSSNKTYFRVKQ